MEDFGTFDLQLERVVSSFEQYERFSSLEYIVDVLNAVPDLCVILNDRGEIIFANVELLEKLNISSLKTIIGKRPGDILQCVRALNNPEGCGMSEACQFCGAFNAIRESQRSNAKVSEVGRITSIINNEEVCFEFAIYSNTVTVEGMQYFVLTLNNIDSEKLLKTFQRIFFHDALNLMGGISGLIQLMEMTEDVNEIPLYIKDLNHIYSNLVSMVHEQKDLILAEHGDLEKHNAFIESSEFIDGLIKQFSSHPVKKNKNIIVDKSSAQCIIYSDPVLLSRVVTNMLKNALEASKENDNVILSTLKEDNLFRFTVHNNSFMEREIQLQVFNRFFSTKGNGRGLGTYSMKLLAEKYLGAKVGFTSDMGNGTEFFIELPLNKDIKTS